MRFVYAAQLEPNGDAVVVSFRDLPECLNSGADEADALEDALEEAVAGRIDDNEPIPVPRPAVSGEHLVVLPADMAAKAALAMAFRDSGLTPGSPSLGGWGRTKRSSEECSIPVTARRRSESTRPSGAWVRSSSWRWYRC